MSWIWMVANNTSGSNNDGVNESLKVEWAKSRARRDRWAEELLILSEEIQRIIAYYEWKEDWWRTVNDTREYNSQVGLDITQGVTAYALKQAALCHRLAHSCTEWWLPMFKKHNYYPDWAKKYIDLSVLTSEDYCILEGTKPGMSKDMEDEDMKDEDMKDNNMEDEYMEDNDMEDEDVENEIYINDLMNGDTYEPIDRYEIED
ncbi:hypothetical protein BDQ17DRAFT_1425126 [Cyathus striatus]|nr:hypothetical protein BDQ17DRAFT_1425126 [Cyathus striatus]